MLALHAGEIESIYSHHQRILHVVVNMDLMSAFLRKSILHIVFSGYDPVVMAVNRAVTPVTAAGINIPLSLMLWVLSTI